MKRFATLVAVVGASLLLGLSALAWAASPDDKAKDKPKNAATFDDSTATLTENLDGKEKTTKVDLKYCLKVNGYFDDKGFHLEEVTPAGPAVQLTDAAGGGQGVSLEKGDTIVEVDGKKIKSAQDYAKAMNGVADPAKTKIKVRDVRTGNEIEVVANAAKR